jgi:AcrR family transcriptional regulator
MGYDAATFQAIAVRADLTRPAVNHYFSSKRVLYREVIEQTNALIFAAGIENAAGETTLLRQIGAFIAAAIQADSEDHSAAAFLVSSILESQRHPELRNTKHDAVTGMRAFLRAAVNRSIELGELTAAGDVTALVEMLVALVWGMGFHACFVGSHEEVHAVTDQVRRLLIGGLWLISD